MAAKLCRSDALRTHVRYQNCRLPKRGSVSHRAGSATGIPARARAWPGWPWHQDLARASPPVQERSAGRASTLTAWPQATPKVQVGNSLPHFSGETAAYHSGEVWGTERGRLARCGPGILRGRSLARGAPAWSLPFCPAVGALPTNDGRRLRRAALQKRTTGTSLADVLFWSAAAAAAAFMLVQIQ